MTPALFVDDLSVTYCTTSGQVWAVSGVSFSVDSGECVAIIGESGSGKSTIAAAVLGLLPRSAAVSGRIVVRGKDILEASERERNAMLGRVMTYVPQDTGAALNPVVPVVDQVAETLRVHQGLSRRVARAEAGLQLKAMGVDARVAMQRLLPDELSGGMRQRALLAIALALSPSLVVADEPTAALDPEITSGVLEALAKLQAAVNAACLIITHDLGVAGASAQRVVVLYGGRVMEAGPTSTVLRWPRHPYSKGLIAAAPTLTAEYCMPSAIPGDPPDPTMRVRGCPFVSRCPHAVDVCHSVTPALIPIADGHHAACHLIEAEQ